MRKIAKSLEIVWRNPSPPHRLPSQVRRLPSEGCGAIYVVSNASQTEQFELICGKVA